MGLTKGPYCVDQLSHQALEQSSYPMAMIACKPILSKVGIPVDKSISSETECSAF